jgi:hypothetical protein
VGCPQQEILANKLRARGIARGLTLCIGASIDFLTNVERRAPHWMQNAGMEWAFRLIQRPRQLAKRYLVRGPRIFVLLKHIKFELLQLPVWQFRNHSKGGTDKAQADIPRGVGAPGALLDRSRVSE